jgi:hypothetical protein
LFQLYIVYLNISSQKFEQTGKITKVTASLIYLLGVLGTITSIIMYTMLRYFTTDGFRNMIMYIFLTYFIGIFFYSIYIIRYSLSDFDYDIIGNRDADSKISTKYLNYILLKTHNEGLLSKFVNIYPEIINEGDVPGVPAATTVPADAAADAAVPASAAFVAASAADAASAASAAFVAASADAADVFATSAAAAGAGAATDDDDDDDLLERINALKKSNAS